MTEQLNSERNAFLIEKRESHVLVGRILLLGFFLLGSWHLLHGCGGQSQQLVWIGHQLLQFSRLLERVVSLQRNGQQVPESVGDHVRDGSGGGITNGQGDHGDDGGSLDKLGTNVVVGNVEDGGMIEGTVVVNHLDLETVREGHDVQHGEKGSLGSAHALALLTHFRLGEDFNATTSNFRGNVQGLEEGSLFGSQRGGNGLDKHILGSHGTGLSRSWLLIGQQFVANFWQVFFGKDEADILNDVRQDLLKGRILIETTAKNFSHHRVFAHQHFGRSSQGNTNLLHLV